MNNTFTKPYLNLITENSKSKYNSQEDGDDGYTTHQAEFKDGNGDAIDLEVTYDEVTNRYVLIGKWNNYNLHIEGKSGGAGVSTVEFHQGDQKDLVNFLLQIVEGHVNPQTYM